MTATSSTTNSAGELAVRMSGLRRLYELIGRVNGGRSLAAVLQSVVEGVVEGLGFGVAVVNLAHADGTLEVVAVAGSEDARSLLLGNRTPLAAFHAEFAVAEHWGGLRFVPHDRIPEGAVTGWIPPEDGEPRVDAVDAWHPWDALFAPLTSPSGELVGMLSVDLPHDGRRPGALQRELLEMFATQAGIAVDNARLSERLRASEASFRLAFDGAATGMTMTSLDPHDPGRFLRVNDAMCRLTGFTAAELTARTFGDITHPDDLDASIDALTLAVTGAATVDRAEKRYLRADGTYVWVAISSSVIRLESGENLYAITQVEDITARKAADAEIAWLTTHDPLTRVLNRAGVHARLAEAIESQRASAETSTEQQGAVLYCDLDGFKAVNDTHGHELGDRVLTIAAKRLSDQVRDGDAVARLGGDEFVIVAERVSVLDAVALAERIGRSLALPIEVGGLIVGITVSIGIAALTDAPTGAAGAGPDVAALLRIADLAMYQAKANGRNGHVVHPPAAA